MTAGRDLFHIDVVTTAPAALRIRGDLDVQTAGELLATADAVLADGGRELTIDLADLAFCDSAGLMAFVRVRHLVDRLTLTNVPGNTERLLDITGLDGIIEVEPEKRPPDRPPPSPHGS